MGIQDIRDNSTGYVTKIIVGLIIVVFALFGFGSITTFLAPVPKVATVNGTQITQRAMEIAVERNRRMMIAQNVEPQNIDEDTLRRNVLRSLIGRALLTQEVQALNMEYSDSALDAEIVSTPAFQVDGEFNSQQFQLVIGSAGFSAVSYREEMRLDKEFQQLNSAIQGTSFLTDKEVRRASSLAQQLRDIAFLRVEVDKLLDDVVVEEAEVLSYYDAHSTEFVTEETIDLEYLELKRRDLMTEVTFEEAELVAFYEETRDLYARDERRHVAHILIEVSSDVPEEDARVKVDGIYTRILAGEDFAQLARENSDDPGSAVNGGDLGVNDAGTFVEEFEAVSSVLEIDQVAEPVLTEFGFHIIKLLGIEEANTPELSEIRGRIENDFRESLAEDIFVTRSARLDEMAFESQDLLDPSEELNLVIKSTGQFGRDSGHGIAANPGVIDAAFSADVLLDGNNSSVIEINANNHVVVRVKEHRRSEIQPLDQVNEEIRNKLLRDKAIELAETRALEMVEMLESGAITRYVADQFGLEWEVVGEARRNIPGMDRDINREAFSLPRPREGNKSVGYAKLPNGDAAVISVTNVQNKVEGDLGPSEVVSLKRVLASRQGAIDFQNFQDRLVDIADVAQTN